MIGMNDFKREPEPLIQSEIKAVERVLRSGWWILGQEVDNFESEWSDWLGVNHAVGVASGMDAIEIGLRVLGVGDGDEVITTAMTAYATVLAIVRSGATPVLADINPENAMLSLESVQRCISSKTKAVVLVHLYGQAGPADVLKALCDKHGIYLVEDCAQAHGAKLHGKSVGSFGIVAAWSFYPTKNLGAVGDAGALTTNNNELAEKARVLRNYGQTERYHHPVVGMNSRLDEIQAALLSARLPYVKEWTAKRRRIAKKYEVGFNNECIKAQLLAADVETHVYHLYVLKSDRRDELAEYLKNNRVASLIHYPIPIHRQKSCLNMTCDPFGLKVTEDHANSCLSIPCHPFLTNSDIDTVIEVVNSFGEDDYVR